VRSNLDTAVRDALSVPAPAAPLEAIRDRGRAIRERSRSRRHAVALAALLLSFAGLAIAAGEHATGTAVHAPMPLASIRPAPAVT
jgi:hypothetical protein